MAMDEFLAQFYGTATKTAAAAPIASDEDLEKEASVHMFLKVASEQDIDLNSLADDQVQYLYSEFVKAASEEPKEEESEEEKKHEEAAKEHAEKKAAAEKVAEADYLGRVMAHSFTQELGSIKEANKADMAELAAKNPPMRRLKAMADKGREYLVAHKPNLDKGREYLAAHKPHLVGGGAAALALGGGIAAKQYYDKHHHDKRASALDELAFEEAVKVAHEGGYDADEAVRKVAAVLELGLIGESEKVASAPDYQAGVGIRALELLEVAGYPVTWTE